MVEQIYGHVNAGLASFSRKSYMEFVLDDYEDELGDRVERMRSRTEIRNMAKSVNLKNRVPLETELAVLDFAGREPHRGPRKAAKALEDEGYEVSASGVRWILKRYELHRVEYRLEAIESRRLAEVVEGVTQLRRFEQERGTGTPRPPHQPLFRYGWCDTFQPAGRDRQSARDVARGVLVLRTDIQHHHVVGPEPLQQVRQTNGFHCVGVRDRKTQRGLVEEPGSTGRWRRRRGRRAERRTTGALRSARRGRQW